MEKLIGFKSIKVDNDMKWNIVELETSKRTIRDIILPYKVKGKDQKWYYTFSDNLVDLCRKYNINTESYCMNKV